MDDTPKTYKQKTAGTVVLSALIADGKFVGLELQWRSVGSFYRTDNRWEIADPAFGDGASVHTINPDRANEFIELWDTEDSELMVRLPEFEATPAQLETMFPRDDRAA